MRTRESHIGGAPRGIEDRPIIPWLELIHALGRGRNFYLRDQARGKTPCPPISRCAYSQPTTPAQVKRVVIQAYGYYARLGGRTAQVVALVKKLFDEAGAAIEVVEGSPLE